MSQAPGARSGKSETKEGVAKTGRVKGAQQSPPHTRSTLTTQCQGDCHTTGTAGDQIPWGLGVGVGLVGVSVEADGGKELVIGFWGEGSLGPQPTLLLASAGP